MLAGTDPNDETSFFTIVDVLRDGEGRSVNWTSVPGREYAVCGGEDLENWTLLEIVVAEDSISTFLDLDALPASMRFYRIEALPLP